MVKKNEVELWSTIKERLSPPDLKTFLSLSRDFNHRRIEKTQLIESALLLFKNDEFLCRCFTDFLQEDGDGETRNDEGEVREADSETEACVRNTESTTNIKVEEATAKNEVESWSTIKERLSPQDLKTLISMGNDFNDRRIGYTQLNASALLLFKNDEFLYRCFTDLLQEDEDGETQNDEGEVRETEACVRNTEPTRNTKESERKVEEATAMAYDVDQEDVAICEIIDKLYSENLICPSELQKLISLVQDKQKISHSEFRESLLLLLEDTFQDQDEHVKAKQDVEDTVLEEGEIREDRLLLRDTKVEQVVNPSYTLIPEEERSPVSATVLNNEYRQVKVVTPRPEKLAGYRKQAAEYEDDMYREDMVIGDLTSAVELWEKVMRREVRIEDVEEKFYTCIRELDRGALVKKLRQNYQVALPRILDRLKEKLSNLRLTQATKKSRWKQIESNARRRGKKVKENNNLNQI